MIAEEKVIETKVFSTPTARDERRLTAWLFATVVTIQAKAHFLDVLKWARVLSGITAGVPFIFYHRNKYRATHLIMNQR